MNMNNLAGPLVHYYDVGNFHATIFKYTTALHVSATTCMVQPTIIHNQTQALFGKQIGLSPALYLYPYTLRGIAPKAC